MLVFAGAGIISGMILWAVAIAFDISAPGSSTINLGLLSARENLVIAGGFLITCGIILSAVDMLDKRLTEVARLLRAIATKGLSDSPSPIAEETALGRLIKGGYSAAALPTEEDRRLRQLDRDAYGR